jgi:hypothetical protein
MNNYYKLEPCRVDACLRHCCKTDKCGVRTPSGFAPHGAIPPNFPKLHLMFETFVLKLGILLACARHVCVCMAAVGCSGAASHPGAASKEAKIDYSTEKGTKGKL